jgi:hypothetical protein
MCRPKCGAAISEEELFIKSSAQEETMLLLRRIPSQSAQFAIVDVNKGGSRFFK